MNATDTLPSTAELGIFAPDPVVDVAILAPLAADDPLGYQPPVRPPGELATARLEGAQRRLAAGRILTAAGLVDGTPVDVVVTTADAVWLTARTAPSPTDLLARFAAGTVSRGRVSLPQVAAVALGARVGDQLVLLHDRDVPGVQLSTVAAVHAALRRTALP